MIRRGPHKLFNLTIVDNIAPVAEKELIISGFPPEDDEVTFESPNDFDILIRHNHQLQFPERSEKNVLRRNHLKQCKKQLQLQEVRGRENIDAPQGLQEHLRKGEKRRKFFWLIHLWWVWTMERDVV